MTASQYPRRLIEVDLPIKRISEHARPEKTTVHGNISTLHIWWARRPHAACRAVLCASLWPDPADPACPESFVGTATRCLRDFTTEAVTNKKLAATCSHDIWRKWQIFSQANDRAMQRESHANTLRYLLLDFIADFSKWENQAEPAYLRTAREITRAAHQAISGTHATRPLVFDPFAGGGTIPLEAIRLGADAFASDLNPIAVLLNKVVLEFIPRGAESLTKSVACLGNKVKEWVSSELDSLYPKDPSGGAPLVYLWGRTVVCEGPGCGFTIPLIRTFDLGNGQHLRLTPDVATRTFRIEVENSRAKTTGATVRGGSVSCPVPGCGYTTAASSVRAQLKQKHGGSKDAQLLAVLVEHGKERKFRTPIASDLGPLERARNIEGLRLSDAEINPIRPHKNTRGLSAVTRIGMVRFQDLYTPRQLVALSAFSGAIQRAIQEFGDNSENRRALTIIGLCFGRLLQQNSSCARWRNKAFAVAGSFGKQALQVVWDFAEIAPLSEAAGSWDGALEWARKVIELNQNVEGEGTVAAGPAQSILLPHDSADVLFTDPPYFAAIPYADLANFFYVWEREIFVKLYPELFEPRLVDQTLEIIVTEANTGPSGVRKDDTFFRDQMAASLSRAYEAVRPSGIGVVVFADTRTASWEALLSAVIQSGWMITASWPIDTEHQNRTQAQGSASLQSSIHLVCRPRDKLTGRESGKENIGDWRDLLAELPNRMHEWMPRLQREGIVGADAIFACLGPALEIYSRYSKVEKASGEQVGLKEYLEYVWAAVAKEALNVIFEGADATGFEEDARLTAMWLWTLSAGTNGEGAGSDEEEAGDEEEASPKTKVPGFQLEYDAARKIAQGLGAHLEQLGNLVEIRGDVARLLAVSERARQLFGKDESNPTPKRRGKPKQLSFADVLADSADAEIGWEEKGASRLGNTVLDRVHQSMILFAAGRGEALRRFLTSDGVGADQRFWRLAQHLAYLYPKESDERRWVLGVLARKKGLGF